MESLTKEDVLNLKYFWEEKEDLERLIDFERLRPILERQRPEVIKVWDDYKISKRMLNIVIANLAI